ncbi:unnamed protein product [Hermetia illucens]|uniref:Uncharacterized protein n=1 Tax=Hermetia illucens TaxID=343691 RepID=A0A7R8UKL3_HERIL|nr:unnamed protein product [Hermetia illucens]
MKTGFAAEPSYEPDYAEKRMAEFKEDPENMKIVQDFVDDVLRIAQMESEQKLKSQQGRGKSSRESKYSCLFFTNILFKA